MVQSIDGDDVIPDSKTCEPKSEGEEEEEDGESLKMCLRRPRRRWCRGKN
jgi:hypothetical protein